MGCGLEQLAPTKACLWTTPGAGAALGKLSPCMGEVNARSPDQAPWAARVFFFLPCSVPQTNSGSSSAETRRQKRARK